MESQDINSSIELVFYVLAWYNMGGIYYNCRQSCIGWLAFILHRMEVMHMNNKFDFKDMIQFGMFIIALLTFI